MKQFTIKILLASMLVVTANAGEKFANISPEYLELNTPISVRLVIAKDPKTSPKVLKILVNDSDINVREYAKKNLG